MTTQIQWFKKWFLRTPSNLASLAPCKGEMPEGQRGLDMQTNSGGIVF